MKTFLIILIAAIFPLFVFAQPAQVSDRLADTAMNRIWVDDRKQPGIPPKWTYEQGVVLRAIEQMWYANGDGRFTLADSKLVALAVDAVERDYPELVGGLGLYSGPKYPVPHVHIDARGTRARWRG